MSANAKLVSLLFQRYWSACLSSVRLIPSDALCFYCMSQCQASSSVWYMFTDQRADSSAIYRNTPLPITGCVGPKQHRERIQGNTSKRWKIFSTLVPVNLRSLLISMWAFANYLLKICQQECARIVSPWPPEPSCGLLYIYCLLYTSPSPRD